MDGTPSGLTLLKLHSVKFRQFVKNNSPAIKLALWGRIEPCCTQPILHNHTSPSIYHVGATSAEAIVKEQKQIRTDLILW